MPCNAWRWHGLLQAIHTDVLAYLGNYVVGFMHIRRIALCYACGQDLHLTWHPTDLEATFVFQSVNWLRWLKNQCIPWVIGVCLIGLTSASSYRHLFHRLCIIIQLASTYSATHAFIYYNTTIQQPQQSNDSWDVLAKRKGLRQTCQHWIPYRLMAHSEHMLRR